MEKTSPPPTLVEIERHIRTKQPIAQHTPARRDWYDPVENPAGSIMYPLAIAEGRDGADVITVQRVWPPSPELYDKHCKDYSYWPMKQLREVLGKPIQSAGTWNSAGTPWRGLGWSTGSRPPKP